MRVLHIILGLILIFFAALQYDDPDGPLWILIYGLGAVWPLIAAFRPDWLAPGKPARYAAMVSLGFFVIGFFWLLPTINWNWIHIETARESLGYLICAVAAALALADRRVRISAADTQTA